MRGARGGPSLAGLRKAGWRITVGKRRRRGRDRADGRPACPASPALSPRRFRGRHRAVCYARLSAGLRTHGREGRAFFLRPPLPRARPQCWWRVRSQLPLRGSAGVARTRHRLPVLIPWLATTGTDGHNIVGHAGSVNTKCCVEQSVSARCGFHGFALLPVSHQLNRVSWRRGRVRTCLIASVGPLNVSKRWSIPPKRRLTWFEGSERPCESHSTLYSMMMWRSTKTLSQL